MKQSRFRYLGLLDLVLVASLVGIFGVAVLGTVPIFLMGLAGVCAVLAGSVSAVAVGGVEITWRHLVGVSYVAFALVLPAIYVPDIVTGAISRSSLFVFAITTVGAVSLAFYGIEIARGGRHFTVTPDVNVVLGR